MIGPQRRSLIDGKVIRRRYTARARFGQIIENLIDIFDFPIRTDEDNDLGSAFPLSREPLPSGSQQQAHSSPKQSFTSIMNELLCAWLLNATPDGQKTHPLDIGWATHSTKYGQGDDYFSQSDEIDERTLECSYTCITH